MNKVHPWALILGWVFLWCIVKEELFLYVFWGGLAVIFLFSLGFFEKR